ncbi:ParB/RepB/Spo0J family partition protein [Patescibacteria group bacterium]|nr:ParB/RepB/Spo0J family partition protein [Patescibacteria group bacterium]
MAKKALGRGLASLIPLHDTTAADQLPDDTDAAYMPPQKQSSVHSAPHRSAPAAADAEVPAGERVFQLAIELVEPNPDQPRKDFSAESLAELAASIKTYGIIQPLVVREQRDGDVVRYQIIAGERRYRAAKLAGLTQLPAIVKNLDDSENLEVALVENIQREDLNIIERAEAYRLLMSRFGLTQQEVADRVGKSRESVANTVRMLNLPRQIIEALRNNVITFAEAKILLYLKEPDLELAAFEKLVHKKWNTQELESEVRKMIKQAQVPFAAKPRIDRFDPEVRNIAAHIEELLGTNVDLRYRQGRGQVVIHFYSKEELEEIARKMQ